MEKNIHNLKINSDIVDQFDLCINSNRVKSRISTLGELIDILWQRNVTSFNDSTFYSKIPREFSIKNYQNLINTYVEWLRKKGKREGNTPMNHFINYLQIAHCFCSQV